MGAQEYVGLMFKKVFGSRNERLVKRLARFADAVEALEPQFLALSDDQLKAKTAEFKERLKGGEPADSVITEAFATLREASRRAQNHRHFKCQLVGGRVTGDSGA